MPMVVDVKEEAPEETDSEHAAVRKHLSEEWDLLPYLTSAAWPSPICANNLDMQQLQARACLISLKQMGELKSGWTVCFHVHQRPVGLGCREGGGGFQGPSLCSSCPFPLTTIFK